MNTQKIHFSDSWQALVVFPNTQADLPNALEHLGLTPPRPVLVLIGGAALVEGHHKAAIEQSTRVIAKIVEETQAVIICGGTDSGVMATIGQIRAQEKHSFPLIGIAPQSQVSWPGGPKGRSFLGWGKKRWPLETHYTHFILVPGDQIGDESPWIVETATQLSGNRLSVTILSNGGNISRKDVALSLAAGRQVIVLADTGRLADELAATPHHPDLMTVVPADDEKLLLETIRTRLV